MMVRRLRREARHVKVADRSIYELSALPLKAAAAFFVAAIGIYAGGNKLWHASPTLGGPGKSAKELDRKSVV